MKHPLAVALLVALPAAAADFANWAVSADGVSAETAGGGFLIRYQRPDHQAFDLRPAAPLPLPEGCSRIAFWYARSTGDFDWSVLVVDAHGLEHAFRVDSSRPTFPEVRRRDMADWSVWNQAESISFDIPAPLADRVLPEHMPLARKTAWPRPLELGGLRLVPAKDRRDNEAWPERDTIRGGRGECWLTDLRFVTTDGFQATYNWYLEGRWRRGWDVQPRVFPDDMTRASGDVHSRIDIRRGHQGPIVWTSQTRHFLDRAKPMELWRASLELPLLPVARYVVETRAWGGNGHLLRTRSFPLWVIRGPDAGLHTRPAPFRWASDRPDNVFPCASRRAGLTLHLDHAGPFALPLNPTACRVRVRDWRDRTILETAFPPAPLRHIEVPKVVPGTDYTATAELLVGEAVVDRTVLHFGVASPDPLPPGEIPPGIPSRDGLLLTGRAVALAEHHGAVMSTRWDYEPLNDERIAAFDTWLRSAADLGFEYCSFMFAWGDVEVLPGVFHWDEVDRRVRLAQSVGMKVLLTPTDWGNPNEWPKWMDWQPILNQHGHVEDREATSHNRRPGYGRGRSGHPHLHGRSRHSRRTATVPPEPSLVGRVTRAESGRRGGLWPEQTARAPDWARIVGVPRQSQPSRCQASPESRKVQAESPRDLTLDTCPLTLPSHLPGVTIAEPNVSPLQPDCLPCSDDCSPAPSRSPPVASRAPSRDVRTTPRSV